MPKKNLPNRRLHKASGQAFVILLCHDGVRRCHYLGKYSSPESRSEYDRLIGIYTANGRKMPPPEKESAGVLVKELAVKYLQWAEGYYQNSPRESFWHHKNAILNFLVKDFKHKPVNEFTPADLYAIQDKSIKHGYRRQSVKTVLVPGTDSGIIGIGISIVRKICLLRVRSGEVSPEPALPYPSFLPLSPPVHFFTALNRLCAAIGCWSGFLYLLGQEPPQSAVWRFS